jgi:hypothetical protein
VHLEPHGLNAPNNRADPHKRRSMGDTTCGQVEVVACPPEHVGDVLAVINEYRLRVDYFALADEAVLVLCGNTATTQ